ncbi:MAG: hypothetical protein KDA55_00050, partial [Planctomycetales bacterium]|nr:hypothetical protein [Planctomycetales bacterium]
MTAIPRQKANADGRVGGKSSKPLKVAAYSASGKRQKSTDSRRSQRLYNSFEPSLPRCRSGGECPLPESWRRNSAR